MRRSSWRIAMVAACGLAAGLAGADGGPEAKLLPADGQTGDRFGSAVALDGDTALVGAHTSDDNGQSTGSAYVFVRSGADWIQQAKLLPAEAEAEDHFGWSVALQGDRALIGAWGDDDAASTGGAVYEFTRANGIWTETAKLVVPDVGSFTYFGAVDFDGSTAVVGAYSDDEAASNAGAAYIFTRENGVWSEPVKLQASDAQEDADFGVRVAIDGDTVLIGAQDPSVNDSGAAYIFTRENGVWSEQAKLVPSMGGSIDNFGQSVALDGDTAVVGSPGGISPQYAYVYTRSNGVWSETALLPSSEFPPGGFGNSVALEGDTLVVGEPYDPENGQVGSASVFVRIEDVWVFQGKFQPVGGSPIAGFGLRHSIDLSGDSVLVGSQFADDNGDASGAAYVFLLGTEKPIPATGGLGATLLLLMMMGILAYHVRR